jgi:hypothetical protein
MAAQTSPSNLFRRALPQINAALAAHGADETNYGFQPLPAGITNGVAKLVECGFGEIGQGDLKGETYWRAAAVVVSPAEVQTADGLVKVAGRQTSIIVTLAEQKRQNGVRTVDENVATMLNELRKLGADTSGVKTVKDLLPICEALKQQGPYITFSTSAGRITPQNPTPKVFENWHGTTEYAPGDAAAEGVEDDTASAPPVRTAPRASANGAVTNPRGKAPEPVEPESEPAEEFNEFTDPDSLAEKADINDQDAQAELTRLAIEAGMSDDAIAAASWQEMAEAVKAHAAGGAVAEDEPAAEAAWEPATGEVYLFAPTDPKTKRKLKKVEVEVLAVDAAKKTVNVRSLDSKTSYKGVKWDDLEGSSD